MLLNITFAIIAILLFIVIPIMAIKILNLKLARNNLLQFVLHHDNAKENYQERHVEITIKKQNSHCRC